MRTGLNRPSATRLAAAAATLIAAGVLVVVAPEPTSTTATHDRHMYGSTLAEEERSRGQCCVETKNCC